MLVDGEHRVNLDLI